MLTVLVLAVSRTATPAADWPGWRGDGSGTSRERNLPLYWSADTGVVWKAALPGEGHSSPIVWGNRIVLTASTDAGSNRLVLCLDRNDGHPVWRTSLSAARAPATSIKNGYASPTPVTDGERVYAFFDSPGLTALDADGKTLWTRDLGPFKNGYNMASSPVLCGDAAIQCCDQDEGSFIVAIAGGKLFLRTDKALLCIGGAASPGRVETVDLPATFDGLKKLFADHPATDGPDAALRIAIVEKLGAMKETNSVPFLKDVALKDRQWDVGEAAAKSLVGLGRPAIPALIALLGAVDWQPYLKTIAADALGQLAAAEAVPALLKGATDRNVLVRLPALQALGRIAAANPSEVDKIVPVLIADMGDREGMVRKAAIEALSLNAGRFMVGDGLAEVARKLKAAAGDPNPLVAKTAATAMEEISAPPPR